MQPYKTSTTTEKAANNTIIIDLGCGKMIDEQFDEQGNVLVVGNYTFVDGMLGKGSFGMVRLAKRMGGSSSRSSTSKGQSQQKKPKRHFDDGSIATTPVSKLKSRGDPERLRRIHKSASAPYGTDMFSEDRKQGASPMVVGQLGLIFKQGIQKASDQLGSFIFDEQEPDDNLFAVKIFHKSLLKKIRTMERDKETRKMKVHTALEQVEKEIALMKKMHHPNIVSLFEVIDSPESDLLYMVIEYMPLGEILTYQGDGTFRRSTNDVPGYNAKLGHFDAITAALFFVDVLHGLAYLHQHRVVHRDLKPENIL